MTRAASKPIPFIDVPVMRTFLPLISAAKAVATSSAVVAKEKVGKVDIGEDVNQITSEDVVMRTLGLPSILYAGGRGIPLFFVTWIRNWLITPSPNLLRLLSELRLHESAV
jgi:hypothetical protein